MHRFIEFIYKASSVCNKSCADHYVLQSWFFENRAPSQEDCNSLSQDTTKITDRTFSFFYTPICSYLCYLHIWGCEHEGVQDSRRRGNCGCPKAGMLKKQQKATFVSPDASSVWRMPVVGRGTDPVYQSALHCRGLRSQQPCVKLCHINIIHMQTERDLVLQKNKCNNFEFDPAIFCMNTHITFLLFTQFLICSRTSLLSFGDVSWKLPWNREVLTGQLT